MINQSDKQELLGAIQTTQDMVVTLTKEVRGELLDAISSTKQEILDVIQAFAQHMDERFEEVDHRFEQVDHRLESLKERMTSVETKTTSLGSQMVTKSYLDDRLADLRGDLIVLTRKHNVKLSTLVEELVVQGSLSRRTADRILALEPFAQQS